MSFLLWLICVLLLVTATLVAPHPAMLAICLVFVVAPVISWALVRSRREKMRVRLVVPGVVGKGKEFVLRARLECASALPCGKVMVTLRFENTATGEVQERRLIFRDEGELALESAYCGCIECHVVKARCYDLFGVLPMSLPCTTKKLVVVMPDTFPVEMESVLFGSSQLDCYEYAPDKKGFDRSETLQVRDYVPGDPLQQIHWKLSSKLDKLIVRDSAQPVDRNLMVFVEQCDADRTPAQADALLEATVSVCQSLVESGYPFSLAWNEDVIVSYDVSGEEQLPEAISALLKSRRQTSGLTGSALYCKTKDGADVSVVLYFCSALHDDPFPFARTKVLLCGEGSGDDVVAFSPESMSDTLRNLTWS